MAAGGAGGASVGELVGVGTKLSPAGECTLLGGGLGTPECPVEADGGVGIPECPVVVGLPAVCVGTGGCSAKVGVLPATAPAVACVGTAGCPAKVAVLPTASALGCVGTAGCPAAMVLATAAGTAGCPVKSGRVANCFCWLCGNCRMPCQSGRVASNCFCGNCRMPCRSGRGANFENCHALPKWPWCQLLLLLPDALAKWPSLPGNCRMCCRMPCVSGRGANNCCECGRLRGNCRRMPCQSGRGACNCTCGLRGNCRWMPCQSGRGASNCRCGLSGNCRRMPCQRRCGHRWLPQRVCYWGLMICRPRSFGFCFGTFPKSCRTWPLLQP